jgi:hypothetical protein
MHFTVYDVFWSHFSHQLVSVAIEAIFREKLLQEYTGTMWSVVSQLFHNILKIIIISVKIT